MSEIVSETELAQKIFKRIVLHNKLMSEEEMDSLFKEVPAPEQAIRWMIINSGLPTKTGKQLLAVYRKKYEEVTGRNSTILRTSAQTAKPEAAKETTSFSDIMKGVLDDEKPRATGPGDVAKKKPDQAAPKPVAKETPADKTKPVSKAKPKPKAAAPKTAPKTQVPAVGSDRERVHYLLKMARDLKASDMHLKSGVASMARIFGKIKELDVPPLAPEECQRVMMSILNDQQREQFLKHNDLDFCYDSGDEELGRFRVNYFRHLNGVDGIFRLIPSKVPKFDELKLPEQVRKFTGYQQGLLLVTGPRGCGKTTTVAALVDLINSSRPDHIITVEEPIEFVHPCKKSHVNQREVGKHTKSFSNALHAAVHEAPDVIVVGELRDLETTSLAITAAETGQLVFSTLPTPDAIRTIGRVVDVFPPKEQEQVRTMLAESLLGILSQMLIPNKEGTGVELAMEILTMTPAIGNLVRENKLIQLHSAIQTGKKQGMKLMDESIVDLAKEGRISNEEAIASAVDANFVQKELG